MKIILKSGTNVIEIPTGAFRATIALAEAMLPYTSDGNFWLKLESDIERAPEPEKSEEQGFEATTQVKDTTPEPEPQVEAAQEPKKKDLNRLRELLNTAKTKKEIAAEFGVSVSSIYNWIEELHELDAVFDKAGASK